MAGLRAERQIGQPPFTAVAPCINNFLVTQRFDDEPELNEVIEYVLTPRMRPTKAKLRLLKQPGMARRYILIQRWPGRKGGPMSQLPDDDALALGAEHESLLGFLYMCPVGVVRMNLSGDIDLANPHAAQYLLAVARQPAMGNFFAALESCAPEIAHMVRNFPNPSGVICQQHRVFVRTWGPGVRVLACSMINTGASAVMAVLQDITKQVEQERPMGGIDDLLKFADKALFEAKRSGGNRVCAA